MVRDVLFDIFKHARVSAKRETPVNFSNNATEGRSTLRPTYILIFGWVRRKHTCVDLTGVSSLVGLMAESFKEGHNALKVATCKVTKHEKSCMKNQHVLILFAFDTFGFHVLDVVKFLINYNRSCISMLYP